MLTAAIVLVKTIGMYNMPIKHSEYIINYLKTYITDSDIVKQMTCKEDKARNILLNDITSIFNKKSQIIKKKHFSQFWLMKGETMQI